MTEPCSPTKPAAPFSPESWYRKAYEESRAGSRPVPEGAGSALGSSGTPSPGSGTSSPGSFTGSPGPASPGIGTSSPGSLGGSPGFGTGSPGSGSGGGSSPGSDRGVWCEHCNARLAELKRQALKLLIPGPVSSKVSRGPRRGSGRAVCRSRAGLGRLWLVLGFAGAAAGVFRVCLCRFPLGLVSLSYLFLSLPFLKGCRASGVSVTAPSACSLPPSSLMTVVALRCDFPCICS